MNQMSGINDSQASASRETTFDVDEESLKVVEEIVKKALPSEILAKGISSHHL
jgi:hypothetical protein